MSLSNVHRYSIRCVTFSIKEVTSKWIPRCCKAYPEVLLRARAIENQCYVLAAAQGGRHEAGRRTWGDSLFVDPWGEVLASLPEGEGVVQGTLRRERLDEVRARLPAWQHRREGSFIRRVYA